jgi:hypothetical protein
MTQSGHRLYIVLELAASARDARRLGRNASRECSSGETLREIHLPEATFFGFRVARPLSPSVGHPPLSRIPLCPGVTLDALRLHLVNDDV